MSKLTAEKCKAMINSMKMIALSEMGEFHLQALEIALPILEQQERGCQKCNGTGEMDSGGTQPWGEQILVECDCNFEQKGRGEGEGEWIKCSARLPEIGQQVLVTNRHLHIYEVAIFDVGTISGRGYFGASNGKFIATHWQPLPSPPEDV